MPVNKAVKPSVMILRFDPPLWEDNHLTEIQPCWYAAQSFTPSQFDPAMSVDDPENPIRHNFAIDPALLTLNTHFHLPSRTSAQMYGEVAIRHRSPTFWVSINVLFRLSVSCQGSYTECTCLCGLCHSPRCACSWEREQVKRWNNVIDSCRAEVLSSD